MFNLFKTAASIVVGMYGWKPLIPEGLDFASTEDDLAIVSSKVPGEHKEIVVGRTNKKPYFVFVDEHPIGGVRILAYRNTMKGVLPVGKCEALYRPMLVATLDEHLDTAPLIHQHPPVFSDFHVAWADQGQGISGHLFRHLQRELAARGCVDVTGFTTEGLQALHPKYLGAGYSALPLRDPTLHGHPVRDLHNWVFRNYGNTPH